MPPRSGASVDQKPVNSVGATPEVSGGTEKVIWMVMGLQTVWILMQTEMDYLIKKK